MKTILYFLSLGFILGSCTNTKRDFGNLKVENDTLLTLSDIPSKFFGERTVQVWLPSGYSSIPGQSYKLVLMLNGKEVFTQNGVAETWNTNGIMDSLQSRKLIQPTVVVSLWEGKNKLLELTPSLEDKNGNPASLSDELKSFLSDSGKQSQGLNLNNEYLSFIVEELIPDLQSKFAISKEPSDITAIGAGRAALSAFKLLCKYPEKIGNIGCLSPEWNLPHNYPEIWLNLLPSLLPNPGNHRLYFDCGTAGTDAAQWVWQKRVDAALAQRGYVRGKHYLTLEMKGAEPNPNHWRIRSHKPFQFLQRK